MTTIPGALDGLVASTRTAVATLPAPAVRVDDGPWLSRPDEADVVAIGWTPDEGTAVDSTDAIAGLASSQESYDVVCLASSWGGDTNLATRRARADSLVEAIRAQLKTDRTLGGAVNRARLATLSLDQFQTASGCEVAIQFVVRVEAFRTP